MSIVSIRFHYFTINCFSVDNYRPKIGFILLNSPYYYYCSNHFIKNIYLKTYYNEISFANSLILSNLFIYQTSTRGLCTMFDISIICS